MILVGVIAALFALGLYGVLSRRDIVGVLASIEVMLSAAALLVVGLASSSGDIATAANGQAVGLFLIIVAASEAAVGMALLVAISRHRGSTRIDELTEVQG